jgi:hypothetical protein
MEAHRDSCSMTIIMPCHHLRREAHVPQYTQPLESPKISQPTRHQKENYIERLGIDNMRHIRCSASRAVGIYAEIGKLPVAHGVASIAS